MYALAFGDEQNDSGLAGHVPSSCLSVVSAESAGLDPAGQAHAHQPAIWIASRTLDQAKRRISVQECV